MILMTCDMSKVKRLRRTAWLGVWLYAGSIILLVLIEVSR